MALTHVRKLGLVLILLLIFGVPQQASHAATPSLPIIFSVTKQPAGTMFYTVNADGSSLMMADLGSPNLRSSDGRFVAKDSYGKVSLLSLDRAVNRTFQSLWPNAVMDWSPDAKHFAIVLNAPDENLHGMYLADEDGSNLRQLLKGQPTSFSWSADSQFLVVLIGSDIYKLNIGGKQNLVRVTNTNAAANNIKGSPDGKHIAFFIPEISGNAVVYVVDSDGKNQHKIDIGLSGDLYPRQYEWSPDGRYLIFSDYRGIGNASIVDTTSWSLVSLGLERGACNVAKPSPDGKQLLCRSAPGYLTDVYTLITVSTGKSLKLNIAPSAPPLMDWSPDGKQIAVAEGDSLGAGVRIVVLDADGSNQHVLDSTDGLGEIDDLMWASTRSTTYDLYH